MSSTMLCGNWTSVGLYWECHRVVRLPSSTFEALPFPRAVSWSLAVATHPVRGRKAGTGADGGAGSVATASATRLSSAALAHGPRLPASVIAVSRTKRVATGVNAVVFSSALSAQVPVATATPQFVPSGLTWISKRPIRPFGSLGRGRYFRAATVSVLCMSMVIEWGSGTAVPLHLLCQNVEALPSIAPAAAPFWDVVSSSLAVTVQPVRGSEVEERAAGAIAATAVVSASSPVGGMMWLPGCVVAPSATCPACEVALDAPVHPVVTSAPASIMARKRAWVLRRIRITSSVRAET